MEASPVNQLLEGRTAFVQENDGLRIYNILFEEELKDPEQGYRVLRIGQPNHRPTRCVLLLGETGAGKTTFINATLNYLFGVRFDDPFRLRVREATEASRRSTESQTDTVTAYLINFKKGMQHDYNFVLLDTPGLADTRGIEHQKLARSRLEALLTSDDVGFDELHCVGLVAKGNTNRNTSSQKAMLGEIISMLGNRVTEITCILATFAVDEPTVQDVMRDAGIPYNSMFPFDNGVLYAFSQRRRTLESRWDDMREQYDNFFRALISAPSVSVRVLKEKKLFGRCLEAVKNEIEIMVTLALTYDADEKEYQKYKLREAKNEMWREAKQVQTVKEKKTTNYLCAHNCKRCQKTCHTCEEYVLKEVCNNVIDAFKVESVSYPHLLGKLCGGVVNAGGAVLEGTGHLIGRPVWKGVNLLYDTGDRGNQCTMQNEVCRECHHASSDHELEKKELIQKYNTEMVINHEKKALYEIAVSKRKEVEARLKNDQQNMLRSRRNISHSTVKLLHHGKRIQEITLQSIDYTEAVSKIIKDKQHEPDFIHHALKFVNALKEVIRRLASCTAEEVLAKHVLVEKMLSKN